MLVIIGHGPSIVGKQLGSWLDTQTLVRLKGAQIPNSVDWGTRTDFVCGTSRVYETAHFWLFDDKGKWRDHYSTYSTFKPSTGLAAIFCAVDRGYSEIGLAGFDNLLHPNEEGWTKWYMPRHKGRWGHDSAAEHRCAFELGITLKDVTSG
jgi:hypothetical protein